MALDERKLTPEELEYYRSGKHGGKSMDQVLTKEKYLLHKAEGMTKRQIMDKYGLLENEINIFIAYYVKQTQPPKWKY